MGTPERSGDVATAHALGPCARVRRDVARAVVAPAGRTRGRMWCGSRRNPPRAREEPAPARGDPPEPGTGAARVAGGPTSDGPRPELSG
ncbi:hypothetical protein ABZ816_01480 [Actinosynnema sp. NPDC047251]|uniref:hypothetical protein n=1 Tax=Saccharothrix espanaensis TaxID=103731 RepID=UPI0002D44CD2|nr:hypothetical protein [Saccharothrix espanaensis]